MLKEKLTSFKKNPDGSYTRISKTIFKDEDTYEIIRIEEEVDEDVYDIVNDNSAYDYKIDYCDFEGNKKYLLFKRR